MIRKRKDGLSNDDKLRRRATFASLTVASTLIAAKFVAYLMTDSVAVLTSLCDSTFDLVASIITACGVASAMKPPDPRHRYGHGKVESLAALAQSIFVIGSSCVLGYEAIDRFYHPRPVSNEMAAYIVMSGSILLTLVLVSYQRHVIRKTKSMAISADWLHYVGDLATNGAVIVAFLLQSLTGFLWIDPLFAAGIALALLYSAQQIVRHAMVVLIDAELPEEQRNRIQAIVLAQEGVQGLHDMRTRSDGDTIFVELHVEMDGTMPLHRAHDVIEKIYAAIAVEFPNADVLAHQDPVGLAEERLDTMIESGWKLMD